MRVWVVELDHTQPKKDQAVRDLLTEHGYRKSAINIRDWCPVGGDCTVNEIWELIED